MAISHYQTAAWNTAGTDAGDPPAYKEVSVTASTGDLLIAYGVGGRQQADTGTNGTISTTSGSTSSWTVQGDPDPWTNGSAAFTWGSATVTTGGTIVVRVTVQCYATYDVGAGVFVVPAADIDGSPTWVPMNTENGLVSASPSATSSYVFGVFTDWGGEGGTDMTAATYTPTGSTAYAALAAGNNGQSVSSRVWTEQTAATRNYGASGLEYVSTIGGVVVIAANTGTNATVDAPTTVAAVAAVDVSGWDTRDSLVVMGGASKSGTWS